ncbi:CLUMA_CG001140, isoform A [Clunio marinus]|uniref:CLUMA_CG001140, isoform A n=1 Tax=Clunio marinus TaxID=568069 RepID=A0A1J1HIF8_9DIPT|nr:CLUMA_CG001140, isoform A [Clunio marinus]
MKLNDALTDIITIIIRRLTRRRCWNENLFSYLAIRYSTWLTMIFTLNLTRFPPLSKIAEREFQGS